MYKYSNIHFLKHNKVRKPNIFSINKAKKIKTNLTFSTISHNEINSKQWWLLKRQQRERDHENSNYEIWIWDELCGISNDNIRLEKLMARVKDNFSAYMKNTTLLPRSLKNSFFPPPRRPLFLSRFCAHSRDQTTPFLLWRLKLIAR